jgi:endonuclease-3 related protein
VLVQQTRWDTAEAAVLRLHDAGLLSPGAIASAGTEQLAELIRPCAFYNQKAPGLQAISRHIIARHKGDVAALLCRERHAVRSELLSLPRIGRETADTIMLYAGGHPVFIVDAYARRLFNRLDIIPGLDVLGAPYDTVQQLVESALAPSQKPGLQAAIPKQGDALRQLLWDLHALIDEACIHHCTAVRPRCDRPGTRRSFADPRKCAEHCTGCGGCPLRATCVYYRGAA